MKRKLMMVAALLLASQLALANEATGELVELTDTRIVVKKGKKDLEIARDPGTRMTGDVKVGDRVTVGYKMTATSIEPKARKKTKAKPKNKDL